MNPIQFDSAKPIDIIAVGRATIDLNPNELHRPLSEVATFSMYLGGSPANIVVGMSRLGKKTGFIGKISNDQFGQFITKSFQKEGVDVSNLTPAGNGENLGLTFTEILSPTESSILMYRRGIADLQLSVDDVSEEYIKKAKILLVSGTALSASPSREACFLAMNYAKKHGAVIIFDIDYRNYTWQSKAEIAVYYSLAGKLSDIVIGSREEFDLMEMLPPDNDVKSYQLADKYLEYGNKIAIIKFGKKGSVAYCGDTLAYKVESFPVKLLKSFGGGDAYASAFIYGLLENWAVPKALEFASASASMVVASHSCSTAMPAAKDIAAFIAARTEQVVTQIGWKDDIE
ncbi:5-dehydro-2-deoxygluconokinase|uniref:5-dehydro-2-deoxygluconokinase n=1 Tax=Dendrosporobacter quercicolus TaxID=146817 RepID=A0A1G9ST16_9FIRM|nr:5-dehydro-2-deoxygluconokinase [Dendrosporobacter quercicolus]NSL48625.1 5-dehydro-2-deoxygluconokinase [Dendrosporobacter quercicolus DSM 1736]SDM38561.1 5-dehydro-2-deoxygluconokinase [Dendrosporobacter quercicolus]